MNFTRCFFIGILFSAVFGAPSVASGYSSPGESFQYGPRPAVPVFDPTGQLPPALVQRFARSLASLREHEQIDMVVVQLPDLRGAPPEHVAAGFARAWCQPVFNCVVLHVPEHPESPWIFPGGTLMRHFNPSIVENLIAQARRRARLEAGSQRTLEAATDEAADMLRIWVGDGTWWLKQASAHNVSASMKTWNRNRLLKMVLPLGGGLLVLAAGAGYGLFQLLDIWRARCFQEYSWPTRLGAPYAGGNDSTRILTK